MTTPRKSQLKPVTRRKRAAAPAQSMPLTPDGVPDMVAITLQAARALAAAAPATVRPGLSKCLIRVPQFGFKAGQTIEVMNGGRPRPGQYVVVDFGSGPELAICRGRWIEDENGLARLVTPGQIRACVTRFHS